MPAHFTIVPAERKRVLPRLPAGDVRLVFGQYSRQFSGILNLLPTPAFHFSRRRTRVSVPTPVVPGYGAIGSRHPGELRDRISQGVKMGFAFPQRLFSRLDLGYIAGEAAGVYESIVFPIHA